MAGQHSPCRAPWTRALSRGCRVALVAWGAGPLAAQVAAPRAAPPPRTLAPRTPTEVVASWIAFDAPAGAEERSAPALVEALTGWSADRRGNLVRRVGTGAPRRVVACAMDRGGGYAVSQVTDEGYLRLRRVGAAPSHPLRDQFLEAQRVKVLTARGAVTGVVAVTNGHFASLHRGDTLAAGVDDLWVDVGAASRAEVGRLGIALLDPVLADRPMWTFADHVAGPNAGARAACAVVAATASAPMSGETVFILSTQNGAGREGGWNGLAAAIAAMPRIDQLTLVDEGASARMQARLPRAAMPPAIAARLAADSVTRLRPRVRWAGSLVEALDTNEVAWLRAAVATAADVATPPPLVALPTDSARRLAPRRDAFGALERTFLSLVDLPGVSRHEGRVRDAILAALPAWARADARVDSAGNVVLAAGSDAGRAGDAIAFLAHMDEVGFEVDRILPDGRVTLRVLGGVVLPSWEGVPALLHADVVAGAAPALPLRGVFIPRDSGPRRTPRALAAWFGMDSAQLVARGVREGMQVTAYKRAARLAGTRLTARGSDDRTGSTALLAVVARLDPARLPRRVYFVWTVQEENGLLGAQAFGARYGGTLERVYAIDTFVSSDTPLESPHLAHAPLGGGAVLRGLDNSTYAPRAERARVIAIARANAIPLQVGTTFGGTDASAVSPWGPAGIGLSWPGRYSHGPAEVLDLRDVDALVRLVHAVAMAR